MIKSKNNNLVVTKPDKGKTMVTMEQNEYVKKTQDFIRLGPYVEIKYNYMSKF